MKAVGPNAQQANIALLEQILEAAGEGIGLVRSDTTIGYINKVGREILRYSRRNIESIHHLSRLCCSPKGTCAGKKNSDS